MYAPIRDHAAIGDGRTVALITRDGTIDWLCLPDLDSPSVFGSLLDARTGGSFVLAPNVPFEVRRRYAPSTNVLETTFETATGSVRVLDAMTLPDDDGLAPTRELCRRVEAISGRVPMRWRVEPRFGYGAARSTIGERSGIPVATSGNLAIAVHAWDAGTPAITGGTIGATFTATTEAPATIAMSVAAQEPLVFPTRDDVERRLDGTIAYWRAFVRGSSFPMAWRDAVERSALTLKLLVFAPSGALAAAATTSLPESLGGERNWDYRFCWVRDAAFTLSALFRLGDVREAESFFWWLMHASQRSHPSLDVLYALDGGLGSRERTLSLEGYAGSRPVRIGNAAAEQMQLDVYGELLHAASTYVSARHRLDADIARRLAGIADLVCDRWGRPDAGIWEVRSTERHFTHSKMMCWIGLDRAIQMASDGHISGNVERWTAERDAIASFVESRCWSDARGTYMRAADGEDLDAAVLLGGLMGYRPATDRRMRQTIDTVARELRDGSSMHRYTGEDGLSGGEGAFLACSFWLVEALARSGQVNRASALMFELSSLANDVGLYAEEIDPDTGAFLGNFPQALTHLALIGAAVALDEEAA
ncbi:MAG TPA: glycoside hydrolase family 15 protein [Candidatus Limnocylindrales bacterium]|nr:glycoside hydrolase family 15 protein [Candidatus Limnocylindrales bacterium]